MVVGTIHTVFNGKAGIDYFFERMIREINLLFPDIKFKVFCNRGASSGAPDNPGAKYIYIRSLDNQYTKALWLEFFSARYADKENLDLFWIPSGANSFPGRWNIPTVTTIHDIGEYYLQSKYDFIRTVYRKNICIKRSLKRSACLVTGSKVSAQDIRNKLSYSNDISVVYIAGDPWLVNSQTHFKPDYDSGVFGAKKFILCVGRRNYYAKGIDTLLAGYRTFLSNTAKAPILVLVGPKGKDWHKIRDFINKNRLQQMIFDLGEVSSQRLDLLYTEASLVINASRCEGFGMPLVESMSRGKPILCSDLDIFREIALEAPVYFKCGDSKDLSDKLTEMFNAKIDLSAHIDTGRKTALRYSWEAAAAGYQKIFKSLS
jgi:glycosyltransferase involved in cell wall biosynthesis